MVHLENKVLRRSWYLMKYGKKIIDNMFHEHHLSIPLRVEEVPGFASICEVLLLTLDEKVLCHQVCSNPNTVGTILELNCCSTNLLLSHSLTQIDEYLI